MAQDTVSTSTIWGDEEEQKVFTECSMHYNMAVRDLTQRIRRKNGFDDSDKTYFGHLPANWPYRSQVTDQRVQTAILEKDARLLGGKLKGRFAPRENSDEIGAAVLNELFNFQIEDISRIGLPLIVRWLLMSQQTRRYGASFALALWHYEERGDKKKKFFDGPDFKVLDNRDALPNPSYSEIKNWFQYREWVTLADLKKINATSQDLPMWKNLDRVELAIAEKQRARGQQRSASYVVESKVLRNIEDFLGQDPVYQVFELVHELRNDSWISFAPKLGIVLRDIPNPYKHGEIPVIMLRYNPIPDDLYGVSDVEVVSSLQKAGNAFMCQYMDAINNDLYPPLMINPSGVRMHTIKFEPEAKWLMNRPGEDVVRLQTSTAATARFPDVYSLILSGMNNALGETSAALSAMQPFGSQKTATEIRETATIRNVRDNYNQLMLSEAIKKQAYYWMEMDKQFMFDSPKDQIRVIKVVGREAVNFFKGIGMHEFGQDGANYPVNLPNGATGPQFQLSPSGQQGDLLVTKEDMQGSYDYIPDVESMQVASDEQVEQKLQTALQLFTNPIILQEMKDEGKKPKITELIVKLLETTRVVKSADQFFETIPQQQTQADLQPQPKVTVNIKADAATPQGQELLAKEGLAQPPQPDQMPINQGADVGQLPQIPGGGVMQNGGQPTIPGGGQGASAGGGLVSNAGVPGLPTA